MEKNDRGYSLPELLAVMSILTILAALALPTYLNQVRKAQSKQANADIEAMKTEITEFHLKNDRYPHDVQPDTRPEGVTNFKLRPDTPGNSPYDYDHHCLLVPGDTLKTRFVRIVWFGFDGIRQHNHENVVVQNIGDDVVVTIAQDEKCPP